VYKRQVGDRVAVGDRICVIHANDSARLDRAREHEADRLKQRDGRGVDLPMLASNGGLADVASDEVDALDLRDRGFERLRDGRLDQPLAKADPKLTRDDLDEEARGLWIESPE